MCHHALSVFEEHVPRTALLADALLVSRTGLKMVLGGSRSIEKLISYKNVASKVAGLETRHRD